MFLHELRSSDPRFKSLRFHTGLNLLVAERTERSDQGDSRNGTGKSSFVRILRYLLGGSLPPGLKSPALADHNFSLTLSVAGGPAVIATRFVTPTTRVQLRRSPGSPPTESHVDAWRSELAAGAFGLSDDIHRPTPGQLWGQLVRTEFASPVKTYATETDWEAGTRLGYFFGLDPDVLASGGHVVRLEKQRKILKSAIKEGAVSFLALDEAGIRAQLANARTQRDRTRNQLGDFKVDDQYRDHQIQADTISARIRDLNDASLSLERRAREIREVARAEAPEESGATATLAQLYAEIGINLPDAIAAQFDAVAAFHDSVIANRFRYLADELERVDTDLRNIEVERAALDEERAGLLRLLRESVALDTFLQAQADLSKLEADVADLERRLESAESVNDIDTKVKIETESAKSAVRNALLDAGEKLDVPIALFNELGAEIYRDHTAQLLVSVGTKAALKVEPKIDGDASDGIKGVATFLLDVVTVVTGIQQGRAPGLLVHDSHLFDAVDHRQVASCLNIGARLADEFGFQYVVTMNSDFLASVESEAAFDRAPYLIDTTLKDDDEHGGLFGFRFDSSSSDSTVEFEPDDVPDEQIISID